MTASLVAIALIVGCASDPPAHAPAGRIGSPEIEVQSFAIELDPELIVAEPFELGARTGDRLYLARGDTVRAFRLEREAATELARIRFEEHHGPMSYAPSDLVASDGLLVVESDSHIELLDDALRRIETSASLNVFGAAVDRTTLVTVGPDGAASWICNRGVRCETARTVPATENPYDVAVAGGTTYAVESGEEVLALSPDLEHTLVLPLPGARAVVALGTRAVVTDDQGVLHVVERAGDELRIVESVELFRPNRLRAGEGRVWLVGDEDDEGDEGDEGDERVALVLFDERGRATVAADTRGKAWELRDVIDVEGEILAVGAHGVQRLHLVALPAR